ncbi:alpha/beta hydrolase [Thioalkalivibrio sp. ARh3]|uniref:alpha/beta hydrolase n=1 Tax=Thioalkalivibrio sp. ARh3 TaxID=1158148 RepID=UPI00035F1176|nr:alpha/beta hydrolase [Thioalkalivibrio sp. ARh3]
MRYSWITAACAAAALVSAPAFAAEKVTLEHDDLTLIGHFQEGAGASPEDGVVLMLHGTLAHGRMEIMQAAQDRLADRGHNTLSINLSYGIDGREGMFQCDAPIHHGVDEHLKELALWQEWLEGEGYGPVTLFGHSRGGNQVARYLTEHDPDDIRAMVVVAPSTFDAEKASADYEEQADEPLGEVLARAQEKHDRGDGSMLEGVRFLQCGELDVAPHVFLSYYDPAPVHDTPSVIDGIQTPTLVVIGSEDDVVADLPERMDAVEDKEHITVKTVDGADHFFRDFFADDVVDFTADFLDQH